MGPSEYDNAVKAQVLATMRALSSESDLQVLREKTGLHNIQVVCEDLIAEGHLIPRYNENGNLVAVRLKR